MEYQKTMRATESIKTVEQLTRHISELANLPLCNQISNLILEGRFQEAIDFRIDYSWIFSVDDFIAARQVKALVEKQDFIDLGVDKKAVAYAKFVESEEMCRDTNVRLELNQPTSGVAGVLHYAMLKIDKILGDVPEYHELNFSFGPGATTSTKSVTASPRAKMSDKLECSINLVPHVGRFLAEFPLLSEAHCVNEWRTSDGSCCSYLPEDSRHYAVPVTIACGKLEFVPKDCTKHRCIVVEPSLNGLGQKGIGTYMKQRLSTAGVNLKDQSRNQKLAREGSISGNLATIDLSMASDCVSRNLVWSLLPFDWSSLLEDFRTPVVTYRENTGTKEVKEFTLEKFSSMGNAYTFELESLIFYALAYGTCTSLGVDCSNVSVYGDDIIVPVEAYDLLEEVLQYCGFKLNSKKSFKEGPFRESCGADYYCGIDIRPYYLKTGVSGRILFGMHNFFYRNGEFKTSSFIEDLIPEPLRLYGPNGYGDGHLLGAWTPRLNRKMKRKGFEGGFFDTYTANPKSIKGHRPGDYVYPSYSIYMPPEEDDFESDEFILPDVVSSSEESMYRVRGTRGYAKVSIYTLSRSILGRASLKDQ